MNEEIRAAIEERIGLGYTKDDIVQELQSAGYPAEVAGDLYDAVISGVATPETPDTVFPAAPVATPPDQPPVASVEQNAMAVPNVTQESSEIAYEAPQQHHKSLNRNNYLVLGLLLLLCVGALAGGVYAAKGGSLLQKIGLLGSAAPYTSEVEMMGGMFSHFQSLTAYGFNLDYEVALEPRDPSTPTVSEDFFSEGELDNLADAFAYTVSEGFAKFTASGLVDVRDKTNPKFDISMQLNVLAEPFILNAGGSMLVANSTVYGKIDKFPANFRPFLFGVPENTWIILQSGLEFDAWPSAHPLAPMGGIQAYRDFTPTVVQLYADEMFRLLTLGYQEAAEMAQGTSRQMASGITALGLDTSMGPEERQMIERSLALLKQYPVVRFTGEPEQVKVNEEVLYRYDVDIDYENLRKYFSNLTREAESITGQPMLLSEFEMGQLLPDRKTIEEINRLTDMVLTFRPDGGLAEMVVTGALAFNHPDITNQIRLNMSVSYTKQNDGMNITAPVDVHPKTLEEIITGYSGQMSAGGNDASVKQSMSSMRSYAELSYNDNGFNYAMVCEDARIQERLSSIVGIYAPGSFVGIERDSISGPGKIVCNDTSQSYAIIAPLASNENISWCVDSTGFSGEVSPYVLSTSNDTSCGTGGTSIRHDEKKENNSYERWELVPEIGGVSVADQNFYMLIDNVFNIEGKGLLVNGRIGDGMVKIGDQVYVLAGDKQKKVTVVGMDALTKIIVEASEGDNVGLYLSGITEQELNEMEIVTGALDTLKRTRNFDVVLEPVENGVGKNLASLSNLNIFTEFLPEEKDGLISVSATNLENSKLFSQGTSVRYSLSVSEPLVLKEGVMVAICQGNCVDVESNGLAIGTVSNIR